MSSPGEHEDPDGDADHVCCRPTTMPDPQLSTAKRQQRSQAFSSHMAHAPLGRQLAAAQTNKLELESKLREQDLLIEKLEGDRRWLAEREKEEREEKEREREEHLEDKVRTIWFTSGHSLKHISTEESGRRTSIPSQPAHDTPRTTR